MYHIDSPTKTVCAFDFDPASGEISNRRPCITTPDDMGVPDGCTIDSDDKIWIAHWGGSCVAQYCPVNNVCLQVVPMPVSQVTSCAFGGPSLDQLYVTTASCGLSQEQLEAEPLAGCLFKLDLSSIGVKGVKAHSFDFNLECINSAAIAKGSELHALRIENALLQEELQRYRAQDPILVPIPQLMETQRQEEKVTRQLDSLK